MLEKQYATEEEAAAAIAAVEDFYKNEQPEVYAEREADVKTAVTVLQEIFDRTQFPFMNVTWQSHTNNIGHKDFPGCFRCHDGKHLSADNAGDPARVQPLPHDPAAAGPGQTLAADLVGRRRATSPSRTSARPGWPSIATSSTPPARACHTTDNPGGSDNTSFCSNSACHGTEWKYAGLNAPEIRELSSPCGSRRRARPTRSRTRSVPRLTARSATGRTGCVPFPANHVAFLDRHLHRLPHPERACRGEGEPAPADAAHHPASARGHGRVPGVPRPRQNRACARQSHGLHRRHVRQLPQARCRRAGNRGRLDAGDGARSNAEATPELTPAATQEATPEAAPTSTGSTVAAPAIPHDLAGRDNCLMCHNPEGGMKPAPADHAGRTNDTCQACHRPEN